MARVTVKHHLTLNALQNAVSLRGIPLSFREGDFYRGEHVLGCEVTDDGGRLIEVLTKQDRAVRMHCWHMGDDAPTCGQVDAGRSIVWSSAPEERAMATLAKVAGRGDLAMARREAFRMLSNYDTARLLFLSDPAGDEVPCSTVVRTMRRRDGTVVAVPSGVEVPDLGIMSLDTAMNAADWSMRTYGNTILEGAQLWLLAETGHLHIDGDRLMLDDMPVHSCGPHGSRYTLSLLVREDTERDFMGARDGGAQHVDSLRRQSLSAAAERVCKTAETWTAPEDAAAVPRRKPRRVGNPDTA